MNIWYWRNPYLAWKIITIEVGSFAMRIGVGFDWVPNHGFLACLPVVWCLSGCPCKGLTTDFTACIDGQNLMSIEILLKQKMMKTEFLYDYLLFCFWNLFVLYCVIQGSYLLCHVSRILNLKRNKYNIVMCIYSVYLF